MNPRRLAAASCLTVALLVGAACSGDDGGSAPEPSGAPDSTGIDGSTPATTTGTPDPDDTLFIDDTTLETVPGTILELEPPVDDQDPDETDPPAQAGLPADGAATVGGVDLPAGKVLVADDQRLAWITDEPVTGAANLWLQLYAAYPDTGLYPVLLYDDDQPTGWELEYFFPNQPFELDEYTLDDVLASSAEVNFDPPRQSNGPAPASSGPRDLDASDAAIAALPAARIALVESPRGVDALSYMGWTGNATYDTTEALVTALRSWEERYGARLVGVGPNSLRLAIDRPPATADEAAALSEELVLLAPDLESGDAPVPVVELGDGLVGQHLWTLWWLN